MTKATYERKHLIWSSWFQRVRVHHGGGHGSKEQVLEQRLRAYVLVHKWAERASWEWLDFPNFKTHCS